MAKRVLVVAGREGVAPAYQAQVEMWGDGLDFALASSGNEALWEIRGSPYDLVLSPWQLPEMTGIEFVEVVQALSPVTKVVLIGAPITPALQSQSERLHVFALLQESSPQEVAAVMSRGLGLPLPHPRPVVPPPPREDPAPPRPAYVREPAPVQAPAPAPVPAQAPASAQAPAPVREPAPTRAPAPAPAPVQAPASAPAEPTALPVSPMPPQTSLSPAQVEAVRRALRDLVASVGPQAAFLAGAAGAPLVIEGTGGALPLPELAARMVPALSGATDLAGLLSDEAVLGLSLFSGARYDVYAFTVTEATALLLIFDKRMVESKLGSVWLYTRRIVEELRNALG